MWDASAANTTEPKDRRDALLTQLADEEQQLHTALLECTNKTERQRQRERYIAFVKRAISTLETAIAESKRRNDVDQPIQYSMELKHQKSLLEMLSNDIAVEAIFETPREHGARTLRLNAKIVGWSVLGFAAASAKVWLKDGQLDWQVLGIFLGVGLAFGVAAVGVGALVPRFLAKRRSHKTWKTDPGSFRSFARRFGFWTCIFSLSFVLPAQWTFLEYRDGHFDPVIISGLFVMTACAVLTLAGYVALRFRG